MNKNLEITNATTYCMLRDVTRLLEQKTLKKNKGFLNLCNTLLCISSESEDKDIQKIRSEIFTILENKGLYKGL